MYDAPIFADIQINRFSLHTTDELIKKSKIKHRVFRIVNGEVHSYYIKNNTMESQEYVYVHFQQRKLSMAENINLDDYLVVPPNMAKSTQCTDITKEKLGKLTSGNVLSWNVKGQLKRIAYLMYSKLK